MPDFLSSAARSELMSKVRSKGNRTTEIAMLKSFRQLGVVGWRRHCKVGGYSPDFVFLREKLAVFLDGCFWHLCPEHGSVPKSNVDFWLKKLKGNRERDRKADSGLLESGWIILRIWEHSIKADPDGCAAEVLDFLEFVRNIRGV